MEINYEALIDDPAQILARVCDFVKIEFEPRMLELKKSTEDLGEARSYIGILKQNYRKWEKYMTSEQITRIESICSSLMVELGYPVSFTGKLRRIGNLQMLVYKIIDAVHVLRFEIRHHSIIPGLVNFFKMMKHPS